MTATAPASFPSPRRIFERSADELNRWILGLPREVSSQINQVVIDVLNSQIVVDVANSQVGRMLNLPTLIASVKVQLSPESGGPVQQVPMGGDTYISARMALPDAAATEITVCSFGFAATDTYGNALNVSAGHCDPNADSAAPSTGSADVAAGVYVPNYANVVDSRQVGSFARATIGASEGLDYSLIRFNGNVAGSGLDQPVIRGANGTTLAVTGTASPMMGAPVCKSGQSSAFTCGTVLADRVEVPLIGDDGSSRMVSGFAVSACTLAGDSGGAIVTGCSHSVSPAAPIPAPPSPVPRRTSSSVATPPASAFRSGRSSPTRTPLRAAASAPASNSAPRPLRA